MLFDRVFDEHLQQEHIPGGYLTERARNELLDDLLRFTAEDAWPRAGFTSETELAFSVPLAPDIEVRGRIDRLDVAEDGGVFVIDYKYSAAGSVKDKLKDETLLQAPLYLLAAEHLQKRPVGMFYVGVKAKTVYAGWTDSTALSGFAEPLPMPEQWVEKARVRTLELVREIRSGRIEVLPAKPDKCRYCDARDICRTEVAAAQNLVEGA